MDHVVGVRSFRNSRVAKSLWLAAACLTGHLALGRPALAKSRITFPYSPCTPESTLPGCRLRRLPTELVPYTPKTYRDHGLVDPMSEQGRRARGFYITPMYLRGFGPARTAAAMKRGNLDAVVVDLKDDLGHITYPSKIPLAQPQVRVLIDDPGTMVKIFREQGMYVIGRIVAFKDSRLPYVRPDLGVRTGAHAERLYAVGENWLDAYSPEVQDYLIDIALEAQSLGFDEVQLDYMRFPRGLPSMYGKWLHAGVKPPSHATVIAGFLEKTDRALTIPISADVFGLTTLVDGDPRGLGQHLERMAPFLEAVSPMMYANGMDTYFRDGHITPHVIDLIQCGLQRARYKVGNIVLRPYLQGYSNGVEHMWGTGFIKDQVIAAENAGSDGLLWWNPTMRNEVPMKGMREVSRKGPMVPSLGRRPKQVSGLWCPSAGNVFATAAERERRIRKGQGSPATVPHKAAARCSGSCAAKP